MERIGLLGGTFDPIHNGHIQLAKAAMVQCNLDAIFFIPAGIPPHKKHLAISSFHHRHEMTKRACQKHKGFHCLDIENVRPQPSFSIDTVKQLMSEHSLSELYFIIGEDAFVELETWKNYEQLLTAVSFILCERKSFSHRETSMFLRKLGFIKKNDRWLHSTYKDLLNIDYLPPDISSTMIRKRVSDGIQLEGLLPVEVQKYIEEKRLYTPQ